ncbi:MAG: AgmX/PglI C-terminal domain-containing protein [Polyangiales bacterium]|nr:AgmX/PglI C-terminal domain-containing protein [Myxococcales bacterium]MCB9659657.1 AgmX/PglI C-terminal domain-containing protein [Sandaracinaceae bacterium]
MSRNHRTSLVALLLALAACSSGAQGSEVSATEAPATESTAGGEASTTADQGDSTSAEASSEAEAEPSASPDEPSATSEEGDGAQADADLAESPAGDGPVEEMPMLDDSQGGRIGTVDAFPPVVRLGRIDTQGALEREVVSRVVRTRFPAYRRCFDVALTRDPALAGTLRVRFVISLEGRATRIEPVESSLNEAALHRCVATALGTLRFPAQSSFTMVQVPITLQQR